MLATGEGSPQLMPLYSSRVAPDGGWILGWQEGRNLDILPTDESEAKTLGSGVEGLRYAVRSPGSRAFYKTGTLPGQSGIWSVSTDGGDPRMMVRFDDPDRPSIRPEFAVDRERIYFTLSEHESDVWMLALVEP